MIWINSVLEWSGKSFVGLKVLSQDGNTWKRLLLQFSASAAEPL